MIYITIMSIIFILKNEDKIPRNWIFHYHQLHNSNDLEFPRFEYVQLEATFQNRKLRVEEVAQGLL